MKNVLNFATALALGFATFGLTTTASVTTASAGSHEVKAEESAACPKGRYTWACQEAVGLAKKNAQDLVTCMTNLHNEGKGYTGNGAGIGNNYLIQKQKCIDLAFFVLQDVRSSAQGPNADKTPTQALVSLIEDLQAEGIYEYPTLDD